MTKQLVFIDESGDPGFKINKGSSQYFVIALVIFQDELEAEETALIIKKYRRKIGKSNSYEFKFNKSSNEFRLNFLQEIKNCKFIARAIIVEKEVLYSSQLRSRKESFYNYFLRKVLEKNNNTIKNAKIRIDGSGERAFRKELQSYLKQELNSETKKVMKNLRFIDSKKDVLIQLADMVAGTIRTSFAGKQENSKNYLKVLKKRMDDLWEFK